MTDYYLKNSKFYVAVDCIIFGLNNGELSILLTKRRFEPEKGKWSLMGGFVGENESVDEAAQRVLTDLTGLTNVYMEQLGAFGAIDRDPGERVVSVAYYALINFDELDRRAVEEHDARWIGINEIPQLGFDHPLMISKALKALRERFTTSPIVFNLLPKLFTLSQLQSLCEAILGEEIDKRNFRKRVTDLKCIQPTEFIDKSSSKRGARLHRFSDTTYQLDHKFKI